MTIQPRPDDEMGDVAELLVPSDLDPDSVCPLPAGRTMSLGGEALGTGWSLTAVVPQGVEDARIEGALQAVFTNICAQMSQWEPDSEISRFNRGESGSRHTISPQFRIVLNHALKVAEKSDGAFDPALGQASEAWGFGAAPTPASAPEQETLNRPYDWTAIAIEGETLVQPGGLQLDLSGIAKGFTVDMGLATLRRHGIEHALLEVGGELGGLGVQAIGLPWWVDVEVPPGSNAPTARVALSGWSIASSGNYRRRREIAGRSWSHTIDPQSGRPLDDAILSVTVLARLCMDADALATAITVLGPAGGLAFAEWNDIPARIVLEKQTLTSTAWRAWLD
ncbi:thiamine biosynthesis lipoprotein [Altererythrobacter atlanticus]|uniref:FAD:protein FMN transferase n=1 Tax=Croceibacterium atlanticum TaxID=1267766 RepID=A0A0F7KTX1_9SPHN|nr:FAD:protein FMN transferase [Croceibacterium atlanticum]AKH42245.1 Thiamine biosynthesis lipoprotein ApbE precursor [Croceibacterium atlanticum]MBB5731021.1 thiamine biosynthesis lipoprotein [Croceibacterium atlanticum]